MVFEEYERPVAVWRNREFYRGKKVECLTIILRTGGCRWGKCLMCGYRHERYPFSDEESLTRGILAQLRWVDERYRAEAYDVVKIFTSGSFFDSKEVPFRARDEVVRLFKGKLVFVESRPEYIDTEVVRDFISSMETNRWDPSLYVAIGLETADDFIRERSIYKGFTLDDVRQASRKAHAAGAGVKAYLLMKPPFLTEQEAIDDMVCSIDICRPWVDLISMNLCTVQSRTPVEWYWKQMAYRPPYLWSVLEVLLTTSDHILCDPVGGGTPRGPHNCGICDRDIVQGIRICTETGDKDLLRNLAALECPCKEEWRYVLKEEKPYCAPLTR